MNKIQMFWNKLQAKAKREAETLHTMTGFQYRTTKQVNGVHVEGYSPATGKWYTIKVISQI